MGVHSVSLTRRPTHYRSVAHFQATVNRYFRTCELEGVIPISMGLILFLGFSGRHDYRRFGENNPAMAESAHAAMARVESGYEYGTAIGDDNGGGKKFLLKTVFRHTEKIEVDVKPVTVNVEGADAKL